MRFTGFSPRKSGLHKRHNVVHRSKNHAIHASTKMPQKVIHSAPSFLESVSTGFRSYVALEFHIYICIYIFRISHSAWLGPFHEVHVATIHSNFIKDETVAVTRHFGIYIPSFWLASTNALFQNVGAPRRQVSL